LQKVGYKNTSRKKTRRVETELSGITFGVSNTEIDQAIAQSMQIAIKRLANVASGRLAGFGRLLMRKPYLPTALLKHRCNTRVMDFSP
jgi:hypothetical protein